MSYNQNLEAYKKRYLWWFILMRVRKTGPLDMCHFLNKNYQLHVSLFQTKKGIFFLMKRAFIWVLIKNCQKRILFNDNSLPLIIYPVVIDFVNNITSDCSCWNFHTLLSCCLGTSRPGSHWNTSTMYFFTN